MGKENWLWSHYLPGEDDAVHSKEGIILAEGANLFTILGSPMFSKNDYTALHLFFDKGGLFLRLYFQT